MMRPSARALDYREVIARVDFIRDLTGPQVAGADKFVNRANP